MAVSYTHLNWNRDTEYVNEHLRNQFKEVASGDGWIEERTGLHPKMCIRDRLIYFLISVLIVGGAYSSY